ncbi:MAG: TonB-dependent receptor domain-containing protein [Mangrovibacterium sp.]
MDFKRTVLVFALSFLSVFAMAQKATVVGTVIDKKSGETLIGATVMLQGTTNGAMADFEGNYTFTADAGTYNVLCSFVSYETQVVEKVTLKAGETYTFNFEMFDAAVEIGGVEVVAQRNRESEGMLLIEQRNAVVATQAVGAQELSRKGVSDAEGAVTKVSGISKQEGVKNVFVRGLGDRYNSTTLNGFPVPSEDPEYKNISLDFFSSDIIQAVGVNKVFSANTTGDVAGADINVLTKEMTGDSKLSVDVSVGGNSQTVGKDFYRPDRVSGFGFADKTAGPTNMTDYSFHNSLNPSLASGVNLNKGVKVVGGKKMDLGNNTLQFLVVGSYDTKMNYSEGNTANTTTTGTVWLDQDYQKYNETYTHMLMANVDYATKKVKLGYNAFLIHNTVQSYGEYFGMDSEKFQDSPTEDGLLIRQQINDNTLLVNQLTSVWTINEKSNLDLGLSLNSVSGNEPDRRFNYLSDMGDGTLRPTAGTGRQQRFFSDLKEQDFNVRAIYSHKLSLEDNDVSAFKLGYSGRFVTRNFEAVEYDHGFSAQSVVTFPENKVDLDSYFNQDNISTSFSGGKFTLDRNNDTYSVSRYANSVFGEMVYQFSPKFVAAAGLRADQVLMQVDYMVDRGGTVGSTEINELFLLPSLNLKYELNDAHSLRLGASKTYTMPQAKEISPFRYVDVSFQSQGNPDVKPATNYNVDLKWDWFISRDELLTVTGFAKLIKDPISRVEKQSAGNFLTYDNITDQATVAGAELEVRKNIVKSSNEDGDRSSKLSAGLNTSYIFTKVNLNTKDDFTNTQSELEGASPFLLNVDLSHSIKKHDFAITNSLVFAYFSDRIYTIGMVGYQDIMEKGVASLDLVSKIDLNQHFGISLKAQNLLNPSYKLTRQGNSQGADASPIVLSQYKKGMNFSVGLSYTF